MSRIGRLAEFVLLVLLCALWGQSALGQAAAELLWLEVGEGSASGGGISDNGGGSWHQKVAVDLYGNPIVCWQQDLPDRMAIYVKAWDGAAWVEMGDGSASGGGISNTPAGDTSMYPAIATDLAGDPIVCWGNGYMVYVKRWNGSAWVEMGEGSASGGGISSHAFSLGDQTAIAVDLDGNPIICWSGRAEDGELGIYARRWNGGAWVQMAGSDTGRGISNSLWECRFPAVAMDSFGNPIVCWTQTGDVYLKRWDGSEWVEMGGSASGGGISDQIGSVVYPAIATDLDGNPIVCWQGMAWDIYAKRWNGSAWVGMAGSAVGYGISNSWPMNSEYPAVAFDSTDSPVVFWMEYLPGGDGPYEIYVKRWNGSAWVEMGQESASGRGISRTPARSQHPAIATDPDGNAVICWQEYWIGERSEIYVRRYEGCAVRVNTTPEAGTWTLTGPQSYVYDGSGDDEIEGVPADTYTVTWHPLEGYGLPVNSPETAAVAIGETAVFAGNYARHTGTVGVYTDPDAGTWTLVGPDGFNHQGTGDETVFNVPTGACTVTWHPLVVSGLPFDLPPNSPETKPLTNGGKIIFSGQYAEQASTLSLSVTGITWSDDGRTAAISYKASEPVKGSYYYRLYQTQSAYNRTSASAVTFDNLEDGYYLFVVTARDELGRFAAAPCRVWFINRTWGEEFQVYLTSYAVYGDMAWLTYAATDPCSVYYVRLHDSEDGYTRTTATTTCCRNVSDGIHYFVVTGKEKATGQFPSCGPGRQFFYVDTEGL